MSGTAIRFASVAEAFQKNFDEGLELGAGFAVFIDGEPVIDLIGGFSDRAQTQRWDETTLACVYSSGKAILALLMARAVSDGRLDYEAPVAQYWPEFGANGKEAITVAHVLSHQAGLCGFAEEMPPQTWLDWNAIITRIAAMAPLWPPGKTSGYHPQTFGFIVGELLRRLTGRDVSQTLREDLFKDAGLDIHCGLEMAEIGRCAYMPKPPRAPDLGEINDLKKYAFLKPWSAPAKVEREDWLAAQLPASNMHTTAKALAEVMQPFANGGAFRGEQVLRQEAISAVLTERVRGDDLVLPFHLSWSAGLMRNINNHFGPNENAFGHAGFGGSCILVDPESRMTASYVMSKMSPYLVGDPRSLRLINALYECL